MMQSQLTNDILRYLKTQIQSGSWKPGEKIDTESALAKKMGASRTTVHYTLKRLVEFGVLESFQGKGIYVAEAPRPVLMERLNSLTRSVELRKIMEFRIILESESARQVVESISNGILDEMEACTRIMEEFSDNPKKFVTADLQFHRLMLTATNNNVILRSFDMLYGETEKQNIEYFNRQGVVITINHHKNIVKCFRDRDSEGVRQAIIDHFYDAPCDPPFDRLNTSDFPLFTFDTK